MALLFGGAISDRVNCGSGASLDNLDPYTWLLWVYPTSLATGKFLSAKGDGVTDFKRTRIQADGTIRHIVVGTSSWTYDSAAAVMTTGSWHLVAIAFNSGAAAGSRIRIYHGSASAAASEVSYALQTDGATVTADAGGSFIIGNIATFDSAISARIGATAVFNRQLTLAEIISWQWRPRMMSGCVLLGHVGLNGTGTQADYSGNNNTGTVTGATVVDGPPLAPLFGADYGWQGAFTAAVASNPHRQLLLGVGI